MYCFEIVLGLGLGLRYLDSAQYSALDVLGLGDLDSDSSPMYLDSAQDSTPKVLGVLCTRIRGLDSNTGWDTEKLKEFCKKMEWKFITPTAPHQNGCAESKVKSRKPALKHAVGAPILTPF